MSTHARDIHYQKSCRQTDRRTNTKTNKQTVTDISPACLSACGDNKYASYPDWHISPHADRHHRAIGGQFVTHGWRLSGQSVAPG